MDCLSYKFQVEFPGFATKTPICNMFWILATNRFLEKSKFMKVFGELLLPKPSNRKLYAYYSSSVVACCQLVATPWREWFTLMRGDPSKKVAGHKITEKKACCFYITEVHCFCGNITKKTKGATDASIANGLCLCSSKWHYLLSMTRNSGQEKSRNYTAEGWNVTHC